MSLSMVDATRADRATTRADGRGAGRPWHGGGRRVSQKSAASLVVIAVVAVAGRNVSDYYEYIFVLGAIYALAVLGNNLLLSHVGLLSIGQGALVSVGAYVTAIAARGDVPATPSILLGVLAATGAGLVIGLPAVRLVSHYLALVTLAFALAANELIIHFRDTTGGESGLALTDHVLDSDTLYVVAFALVAVVLVTQELIIAGRLGRTLHLIRDSPRAAASFGVRIPRYKLAAFMYSGALAGLAGGLLASLTAYVSPTTFDLFLSIYIMSAVVMGGMDLPLGAVAGAFAIAAVPQLTTTTAGAAPIILGGVLILAIWLHRLVLPVAHQGVRRVLLARQGAAATSKDAER
jgi:ABC-type branched-subunit amino acid transport system permease subunit